MSERTFSLAGFTVRLLLSLLLVFATYNPTGYSFVHWLPASGEGPLPLKLLVTLLLLILYYVLWRALFAAFRRSGLVAASLAALLLSIELVTATFSARGASWSVYLVLAQYILLVAIAIVIAVGVSWSHILERLTGQLQKRYVRY